MIGKAGTWTLRGRLSPEPHALEGQTLQSAADGLIEANPSLEVCERRFATHRPTTLLRALDDELNWFQIAMLAYNLNCCSQSIILVMHRIIPPG
jgi:hypothetical protein